MNRVTQLLVAGLIGLCTNAGAQSPPQPAEDHESPAPAAAEVAGESLEAYTGRYLLSSGTEIRVARAGEYLLVRIGDQPFLPLAPQAADQFRVKGTDTLLTFSRDDIGRVVLLALDHAGTRHSAARMIDD